MTAQDFNSTDSNTFFAVFHSDGKIIDQHALLYTPDPENTAWVGFSSREEAEKLRNRLVGEGSYHAEELTIAKATIETKITFE